MTLERTSSSSSLVDVLDRVLDKGIVIDAWVRISLVGIDLVTVEARVVVASIATYLQYSDAVGELAVVAAPARSTVPTSPRRRNGRNGLSAALGLAGRLADSSS